MRWLALIAIAACGHNDVTTADAVPQALPCPQTLVLDQPVQEVNGIRFSISWYRDSANQNCGPTCKHLVFVTDEGDTGIYLENVRLGYWSGDQFTAYQFGTFPTINVAPQTRGQLMMSVWRTESANPVLGAGCDLAGPFRTDVPATLDVYPH